MAMTPTQRLEAFWAGETPDQIPYTLYDWEYDRAPDKAAVTPMFADGLLITWHQKTFDESTPGIQHATTPVTVDGRPMTRRTIKTPVGDIHETFDHGWHQKYLLSSPDDYRVMKWIVDHTQISPCYEKFTAQQQAVAGTGVVIDHGSRTPMQTILVDFVGLEEFAIHLIEYEEPLMELYHALLAQFRRKCEIIAAGPARYVCILENFTAETMGPARYQQYHLPVYRELFPGLRSAGKVLGVHYDGRLESCAPLIATAPFDCIESLTPPPEGDMTLDRCRALWPDKLFWSNLNVSTYQLPPRELKKLVLDRVAQAAPDGRRLAFEVSEHLPANYAASMPVVLDALKETRRS